MELRAHNHVCFFGFYDPEYARNRVLMSGFRAHGFDVVECRTNPRGKRFFARYHALYKEYRKIQHRQFSYVIVAFPGHSVVWLARLLFGKRIIFDAFLSLYDSNVFDRKVHKKHSIAGYIDWFLDWYSCTLAHRVLLDTQQHIDYFARTFGIPSEKCIRVPIGSDDSIFYPRPQQETGNVFAVFFHGSFIPLQGVQYILEAAQLLASENICFTLLGGKKSYRLDTLGKNIEELGLKNVELPGFIGHDQLPDYLAQADVCLGIFGDTEKTQRVVPNKVYECMAMKKPVITADTPAMREFFIPDKDFAACQVADPQNLARAILALRDNEELRGRIAENGYRAFQVKATPRIIGHDLLQKLAELHAAHS